MILSHERNIKPFGADIKDFWDGFVLSKLLTGIIQSAETQFKKFLLYPAYDKPERFVPGRWL
jgi:hypothetical protein